jgi:hypothetical protein
LLGAWALAFGGVAAVAVWVLGTAPWVRLTLSPFFLVGFLGVLQARERT